MTDNAVIVLLHSPLTGPPDYRARTALVASLRPRTHDFFTEMLPGLTHGRAWGLKQLSEAPYATTGPRGGPAADPGDPDWPDAPAAYLKTSAAYDGPARIASRRGWPVIEREGGHFAALVDPDGLATDLLTLGKGLP